MTYFKLDIPKVNESISKYKDIKKLCIEDINLVYNGLGYTESAWNDMNAYSFIKKVRKDRYKINEHLDYLDSIYNEINQFKSNIDDICAKQGYRRNSVNFKFDDSEIDSCVKHLNNAINILNDSWNKININSFENDFEYKNLVYELKNEIKSIRNSITDLIININNFSKAINNEINDSKFRLKRKGIFDFNIDVMDYKWKTVNINEIKTIENKKW